MGNMRGWFPRIDGYMQLMLLDSPIMLLCQGAWLEVMSGLGLQDSLCLRWA